MTASKQALAGFPVQAKRPLVAGGVVVAEKPVTPADVVEPEGLVRLVTDGQVQTQRLLGVPERVGAAALVFG